MYAKRVVVKDTGSGAVINIVFPFVLMRFPRLERNRDSDRDAEMRAGCVVCHSERYKAGHSHDNGGKGSTKQVIKFTSMMKRAIFFKGNFGIHKSVLILDIVYGDFDTPQSSSSSLRRPFLCCDFYHCNSTLSLQKKHSKSRRRNFPLYGYTDSRACRFRCSPFLSSRSFQFVVISRKRDDS